MTKPVFDIFEPLPGSGDAPIITAEQMSRFLYNHLGSADSRTIAGILNNTNVPDVYGALQVTYVEPQTVFHGFTIGQTIYAKEAEGYLMFAVATVHEDQGGCEQWSTPLIAIKGSNGSRGIVPVSDFADTPPKPARLPIERPVRIADARPGDILRYCGVVDDHASWPVIGSEVVVTGTYRGGLAYRCTTKSGAVIKNQHAPEHCVAQGFSFVRRPFKAGDAVRYKADATKALGWECALLVDTDEVARPTGYGIAVINHKGVHGSISASDLERIL